MIAVELCAYPQENDPGMCPGPPSTLLIRHAHVAERLSDLIGTCTACFASMLRCWRQGCVAASMPIWGHFAELVDQRVRRLGRGLWFGASEDARQDITVKWMLKLENTSACAPENVVTMQNIDSWAVHAIDNLYRNWHRDNIARSVEWPDAFERDLLDDVAGHVHEPNSPELGDPATLVSQIASQAAEEKRVAMAMERLVEQLRGLGDDAAYFAGWMRFALSEALDGRTPTMSDYAKRTGASRTTGWRRLVRVRDALVEAIERSPELDTEERAFTLNFLYEVASLSDPRGEWRTRSHLTTTGRRETQDE